MPPHEPHTGCDHCGRRALLYSTIRGYVRDGRLRENWAARLLPRADTPSVALCVWCATNYLVERFGEEVRSALWGNRLKGRRNPGLAKMYAARLCSSLTKDGRPCPQRAQRGSRYCFVHDFPTHYANQIRQHGKPCRAKNSKGEPCRTALCRSSAYAGIMAGRPHGPRCVLRPFPRARRPPQRGSTSSARTTRARPFSSRVAGGRLRASSTRSAGGRARNVSSDVTPARRFMTTFSRNVHVH